MKDADVCAMIHSLQITEETMKFILAQQEHLDAMCRITEQAKAQLKNMALDQWQKGYPSKEVWESFLLRDTTGLHSPLLISNIS